MSSRALLQGVAVGLKWGETAGNIPTHVCFGTRAHSHWAQCLPLACRLTCRSRVDQILKWPLLFLNYRWKHFVILFPYCIDFGSELPEEDSSAMTSCLKCKKKKSFPFGVCSLVSEQLTSLAAHDLLLRSCCIEVCTEPACSLPHDFWFLLRVVRKKCTF